MQPHLLRAAHQKISKFNLKFLQQIRDIVDAILKLRGCAAERANFIAPNAPPPWSRRLRVLATKPAEGVRWGPVARQKLKKFATNSRIFARNFFRDLGAEHEFCVAKRCADSNAICADDQSFAQHKIG